MVEPTAIAGVLRRVFSGMFGLPDAEVDQAAYREVPGWDSMGHMELVARIESEFDIALETEEIIDMDSFASAVRILVEHGVPTRSG